jgi:hypothetical protein
MMALLKKMTPSDAIPLLLTIFSLLCISAMAILWLLPVVTTSPREKLQQDVAKELGVTIDDYPYPYSFPAGYFFTILKPGMTVAEVHNIVRAYDKVFRCGKTAEVYYYLIEDPEDFVSIWVVYNEQGTYRELRSEGDSGRTSTDWCSPGLLDE